MVVVLGTGCWVQRYLPIHHFSNVRAMTPAFSGSPYSPALLKNGPPPLPAMAHNIPEDCSGSEEDSSSSCLALSMLGRRIQAYY
jgi:hypothetical protein